MPAPIALAAPVAMAIGTGVLSGAVGYATEKHLEGRESEKPEGQQQPENKDSQRPAEF